MMRLSMVEIICLAINGLDAKIGELEAKRNDQNGSIIDVMIEPHIAKRDVLKMLYEVETGVAYEG